MHIIVPGRIPSKKNSRNVYHGFLVTNERYKAWHRIASLAIAPYIIKTPTIEKCQSITILFYMADNRGRDLTNVAESVMDLLVDCEVIKDDQWQVTGSINLLPMGIDRDNPRAEVHINV